VTGVKGDERVDAWPFVGDGAISTGFMVVLEDKAVPSS